MERWLKELHTINIYNEKALSDVLATKNMPDVYITDLVLKKTRKKVYPEKDVLEYMKGCHTPVAYEDLRYNLWFFPIDVIKRALVTSPSLVLVDLKTYMYAPNFPASTEDMQHLIKVMRARISEKGFLVSKDIASLIQEKCPIIAINTIGYKDWAYRNILKYLLSDYFEFSSSIVSEKGKKLEMYQVYRSFCYDHEHLTFRELKEFSHEVGVAIYWDDVLKEMIRIDKNNLVRNDKIHFNVDEIDRVLEELCQQDYIPIQQVKLFLHFPPIEYPWNSYVLESYLNHSKKFKLFHVCYTENGVFGVIAKANSQFENYQKIVIDMLSKSNEWNNAKNALELIVNKGYQARRRWTDFDSIVKEAQLRREKILNERK